MSSRSAVKSPFANLRPSIVREPSRSAIDPEGESRLLDSGLNMSVSSTAQHNVTPPPSATHKVNSTSSFNAPLLTKKRREVLIPVTFRIPQTLKERLNAIAKRHELNQTDLINEGIELNLQRYS